MAFALSKRSESNLVGVRPELVAIVRRALALSSVDFMVVEGLRTPERQRELLARGYSSTLHSRHLTGHAVDLAPIVDGVIPWDKWSAFYDLSRVVQAAAEELATPLEWGGSWKFRDGPHYQLPWSKFP